MGEVEYIGWGGVIGNIECIDNDDDKDKNDDKDDDDDKRDDDNDCIFQSNNWESFTIE